MRTIGYIPFRKTSNRPLQPPQPPQPPEPAIPPVNAGEAQAATEEQPSAEPAEGKAPAQKKKA